MCQQVLNDPLKGAKQQFSSNLEFSRTDTSVRKTGVTASSQPVVRDYGNEKKAAG